MLRRSWSRGGRVEQLSQCIIDNVIHDVLRRVINSAGFAHLGLFRYDNILLCKVDRLAEELLVDAAKNLDADLIKVIGREA